jgi:hypothetical protein
VTQAGTDWVSRAAATLLWKAGELLPTLKNVHVASCLWKPMLYQILEEEATQQGIKPTKRSIMDEQQ